MTAPLLRFITCGSVDDGKSTLIGRLLFESRQVFQDHLEILDAESKQFGTQAGRADYALLLDGLQAEREQGITIDVAYRYFSTERRRFIVADTPGHEQYTPNMATGASTADAAVILVDARKGVLTQTRRHTRIAAMMGIRHVLLAVNKMDLVVYAHDVYKTIVDDYTPFAAACGIVARAIPISALEGDNLVRRSGEMPWYDGPSVLGYLETIDTSRPDIDSAFRLPVQLVNRPHQDFRGFAGRVAAGSVRPGDAVRVMPSGVEAKIEAIVGWQGERAVAEAGESITVTLSPQIAVSRGDVIAASALPPDTAEHFEARLLWMGKQPLVVGRPYLLQIHAKEVSARVERIRFLEDVNTGNQVSAQSLSFNEIGDVELTLSEPVVFAPYQSNRELGGFILIDKLTFDTVGAGMIRSALRSRANLHWQALDVNRLARAQLKGQSPRCIWFTGLPASGKSTIANLLERRLHAQGRHTYLLDGDNVRHGLNSDLRFSHTDRAENVRRIAEVARLMVDAGLVVLVSVISPFRSDRKAARALFAHDEFIEVFVDTPLDECERRDPKGLYAKARNGALPNFTGIDSPYEPPEMPEIHLHTVGRTPEACVEDVVRKLP